MNTHFCKAIILLVYLITYFHLGNLHNAAICSNLVPQLWMRSPKSQHLAIIYQMFFSYCSQLYRMFSYRRHSFIVHIWFFKQFFCPSPVPTQEVSKPSQICPISVRYKEVQNMLLGDPSTQMPEGRKIKKKNSGRN